MARRFITELTPGEQLEDHVFLIRQKDLRTTTQGHLYIHAVLVDRTGEIPARMWQATEAIYQSMPEGGFLRFKGRLENYKGNLQFIIDAIRVIDPQEVELSDFLPASKCDLTKLEARLKEILGGIKNEDIRALVDEFLADGEIMRAFCKAPAASALHHAYIGGLLEHTVSLLEIGLRVIPLYPRLSLDLVLAGLFLHDIGKTVELSFATNIGYSTEGQLIGHIVQATLMVQQKAQQVAARRGKPIAPALLTAIQHIIVSHHGRYEFGSPKLPATPEAIAIHYIDNLDAKINIFLGAIDADRDPDSAWTNYNRSIETKVFKQHAAGMDQEL